MVDLTILHQHKRRPCLRRREMKHLIRRRLLFSFQEYGKFTVGFKDRVFHIRKLEYILAAQLFHQVGKRVA